MASTSSTISTVVAPTLQGVWVHLPSDPAGTVRQFLYGGFSARSETAQVAAEGLQFSGRTFPIFDYGDAQSESVDASIQIPFGDTWADDLQYFRTLYAGRQTVCYRDSRQRLVFGAVSGYKVADAGEGSIVSLTVERSQYSESVG